MKERVFHRLVTGYHVTPLHPTYHHYQLLLPPLICGPFFYNYSGGDMNAGFVMKKGATY